MSEKWRYPNPQFIRKKWLDLNGIWEFCFDDEDIGLSNEKFKEKSFFNQKINVPYSYHVKKSGLGQKEDHSIVWYRREFSLQLNQSSCFIIHFGAVDYECDVWINGNHMKHHCGGHVPFSIDITCIAEEENIIVIRVKDENSCRQAIGKQSWKDHNFLCWYTRTVGIWQQVWLEETGHTYLTDIRVTPDIDQAAIEIDAFVNQSVPNTTLNVKVSYSGKLIEKATVLVRDKRAKLSLDVSSKEPNFRLNFWTPETPHLYDLELSVSVGNQIHDRVDSYFGMRNIEAHNNLIYLNNQEYYQKLVLDQGYYKDGGMTATPEELRDDVLKIKEMGFNGVRKHQKIEDHRFMYFCDVLGLVMWAEMPSPFEYSAETNENIIRELHPFVKKHYNHPSVIAYTVMNESWGINEVYHHQNQQFFVNALYYIVKSLDTTRLVVGNDGWEHTLTDILTLHDYNDDPETFLQSYQNIERAVNGSPSRTSTRHSYSKGYNYQGEPIMISEFGGIAYGEKKKLDESWGYGERLGGKEEVLQRIENLTKVLMDNENICGFCYTQLSDVEQEVNGLLDADHQYKFDPQRIRKILDYKYKLGFVFV